jgi:hypothetical protein
MAIIIVCLPANLLQSMCTALADKLWEDYPGPVFQGYEQMLAYLRTANDRSATARPFSLRPCVTYALPLPCAQCC